MKSAIYFNVLLLANLKCAFACVVKVEKIKTRIKF